MKYVVFFCMASSAIAMDMSTRMHQQWCGLPQDIVLKILEFVHNKGEFNTICYQVDDITQSIALEKMGHFDLKKHYQYAPELFSLAKPAVQQRMRDALYTLHWQLVSENFIESVKTLVGKEESLDAQREIKTCPSGLASLACMLSMMKLIEFACLDIGKAKQISSLEIYQKKVIASLAWVEKFENSHEWSCIISNLFYRCLNEVLPRVENCIAAKSQKGPLMRGQLVVMTRNAYIAKKPWFMCQSQGNK